MDVQMRHDLSNKSMGFLQNYLRLDLTQIVAVRELPSKFRRMFFPPLDPTF